MEDSDGKLFRVKMESLCPRHVEQVKEQLGPKRADEYISKGEQILTEILYVVFIAVILLVQIFFYDSSLLDIEMIILSALFSIYPFVLLFKVFRFTNEFYDLPHAVNVWRKAAFGVLGAYVLCAGFYFYEVAESGGWFEKDSTEQFDDGAGTECIDLDLVGISLIVPDECREVVWNRQDRNLSDFEMVFDHFSVRFEVKTVYTSETASLKEFEEDFCYVMNEKLSKSPSVKPGIYDINAHQYLVAVGLEKAKTAEYVLARYETIYKGAGLKASARIKSGPNVPGALEIIRDVVKSISYYEPGI